ncbi:hypothetical protein AMTRI_Chr05g56740 [Amborella trichopoda]|nr:heat stress transcription factor A-2 [Amborella trichopoda]|eukprot:XP_020518304.1 heat stress transcription factor A-2 [Amborella trichopoda]
MGFRKVNPDKWEFAHEWFLRGQTPLLKNIIRKRNQRRHQHFHSWALEQQVERLNQDNDIILMDLARIRPNEDAMDEEVEVMSRRLSVTEKRPHQMIAFLASVVDNPDILTNLRHLQSNSLTSPKKPRLIDPPPLPPPMDTALDCPSSSNATAALPICGYGGHLNESSGAHYFLGPLTAELGCDDDLLTEIGDESGAASSAGLPFY